MARRKTAQAPSASVTPASFVGTFYSPEHGVYVATRKDGTITVGRIGKRGVNVKGGVTLPDATQRAVLER